MLNIVANVFFDLLEQEVLNSGITYFKERVHLYATTIDDEYNQIITTQEFKNFLLDEITVIKLEDKFKMMVEDIQNIFPDIIF